MYIRYAGECVNNAAAASSKSCIEYKLAFGSNRAAFWLNSVCVCVVGEV